MMRKQIRIGGEAKFLQILEKFPSVDCEIGEWELCSILKSSLYIGRHKKTFERCFLLRTLAEKAPRFRGRPRRSKQLFLSYSAKDEAECWVALCNGSFSLQLFSEHCWKVFCAYKKELTVKCFVDAARSRIQTSEQNSLTYEQQAGLMGELIVLQKILFPLLGVERAIQGWEGPNSGIKDFNFNGFTIEVKASKRVSDLDFWVNGEEQFLIPCSGKSVFLVFVKLSGGGVTLADKVEEIEMSVGRFSRESFRSRINKIFDINKFSDKGLHRFSESGIRYFQITDGFPNLTIGKFRKELQAPFLSRVKFAIRVDYLKEMEIAEKVFKKCLRACERKNKLI